MKTEIKTITINGVEYVEKACNQAVSPPAANFKIFRTQSAGVFAGFLKSRNGMEAVVTNARRIWYWSGAASLSQLAVDGTAKPNECKFPVPISEITLTQVIEILDVTEKAKMSIDGVAVWKQ